MTPGHSNNLQEISDARKTAVINNELLKCRIDISTLQETRLHGSGSLKERDYTFFWRGKPPEETREYGVGFAVRNTLLGAVVPPTGGSERILALCLNTSTGPVHLVSVYAPTLSSPQEIKDRFYDELEATVNNIPSREQLYLLGDFNARVGADHDSWPSCVGHHGIGKLNENGQRLLEFCTYHHLCITNTYFQSKPIHKVSWRHPRSGHWHQLDLIITRTSDLRSILQTRSLHSAVCDTDHSLVLCRVKLQAKNLYRSKPKGTPRIDNSKTTDPTKATAFLCALEDSLPDPPLSYSAQQYWDGLRDAIYSTALSVFGKKQGKPNDWFDANQTTLAPILEEKRIALTNYKLTPNTQTLQALRSSRGKLQQASRRCANDYWIQLCSSIQSAADTGNIRLMFDGIKKALGPSPRTIAPLKSASGETIADRSKQLDRWVEHYSELYASDNSVSDAALRHVGHLPVMEELDTEPTSEELSKAINSLTSGKAPGVDGITAEVLKCGKPALLHRLHRLLCLCWKEGSVPQDMRNANIVTLYKNKGDRSDCNNYRGISLLSIAGKLFARVALKRLQVLAEKLYPESQAGFRAGRSTLDMIFTLRQLQEKCREQRKPLYMAFVDLTKAFDLVSRSGLFQLVERIGCPPRLLSILQSFHTDMKGTVQFDGCTSEPFNICRGVKQGCVLAPTLFGIFFSLLLRQAFGTSTEGVYLHTRTDGKLFNLSRLKAKTKVRPFTIRDMLFADDAALATHTEEHLQILLNRFSQACQDFNLTISLNKTKTMGQGTTSPPSITISNYTLEAVSSFTYLGSTITSNLSLDAEVSSRIGKAASTFGKLTSRVWENSKLTIHTKVRVYRACVVSTLLYGSEAWTPYAHHERRLNSFHLRCLRRILGVTWQDRVTDSAVLERAQLPTMLSLLKQRRLRWLGHIRRMDDGRMPKDTLYAELESGIRQVGRPLLRYKDVCKQDLKSFNINPAMWEDVAQDRQKWQQALRNGLQTHETALALHRETKRKLRKQKATMPTPAPDPAHTCDVCGRVCLSRIGLTSHRRSCVKKI